MAVQIQLRRGTDTQWSTSNPVLAIGEIGINTSFSPMKFKIGNGTSTWSALPYVVQDITTFAGLTDVQLTSLAVNDMLTWSGSKWINERRADVLDGGNFS
jgi:hypothetical protein